MQPRKNWTMLQALIYLIIALKVEVDKLDINKLLNVPTSLNNFRTKVHDLDVGKLKTIHVDFKNTG